jgi:hypothetical protein
MRIYWRATAVQLLGPYGSTSAPGSPRLTQPTLSQQIRRLEEMVGTPLLRRRREDLRLTEAGAVLLEESRSVCLASPYGCAPLAARKEACGRSPGSSHGVPVTAKTLTPIAALVLAIGVIHEADVLLYKERTVVPCPG